MTTPKDVPLYQQLITPDNPHILLAIEEVKEGIRVRNAVKIDPLPENLIEQQTFVAVYRILIQHGFISGSHHAYRHMWSVIQHTAFFAHVRAIIMSAVE